jgi:hypothetical protein
MFHPWSELRQAMPQRYFPIAIFLGFVMFSVLHALTYRLEQKAIIDAQARPAAQTTLDASASNEK